MPDVAFVGVSEAEGSGDVDPGMPAGAGPGHLLLLNISGSGYEGSHDPPSEDWTFVADAVCSTSIDSIHVRTSKWLAWYDAALETEVPDTGNVTTVSIEAFSNVDPTTPLDAAAVTSVNDSTTSAVSCPSITTVTDRAMIVVTNGRGDNNAISGSAWTNEALESVTHGYNVSSTEGGDSSMSGAYGILASAGASGATTATLLSGEHHANITVALRPYIEPVEGDVGWDHVAFTIEIETDTPDTFTDVTDDYVSAVFSTASRQGWGQQFVPGSASITLKNQDPDLEYSLGHTDELVDVSRKVRISITHDETTTVLWRGYVRKVTMPDTPGQVKLSTIVCRTALARAGRTNRVAAVPVGAGDTMAERIDRILDSVQWPADLRDLDDTYTFPLSLDTDLSGSALAELQLVATSLHGEIYEDVATGEVVSINQVTRVDKWSDDAVIALRSEWYSVLSEDNEAWYTDLILAGADVDEVVNYVDVSAPGTTPGQDRWVYQNIASQLKHGKVAYIRTDLLPTPAAYANNHAYFMIAKFNDTKQRLTGAVLTDGRGAFVDALIGLQLLDAVHVGMGGATHLSGKTQVQGIHHEISPGRPSTHTGGRTDRWTVVLDLDDTEVGAYVTPDGWHLGDPDGSLLGMTTIINNSDT